MRYLSEWRRPALAVASLAVLIAIGVLAGRWDLRPVSQALTPAPTEHVLREDAEKEQKRLREEWIESLHQAAPGTDWRAIEAANHQGLVLERQSLLGRGFRTDDWDEIGSVNQAGRTHATAYSPDDGAIYVGSSLGGVWKGTLSGENWQAISDAIGYASHGLCVAPGAPKVITTFDDGGRVHATINDGESWFVPAGLDVVEILGCKRMVLDLGSPRSVYLLLRGKRWVGGQLHYRNYLFRSDDGGQSYALVHEEPLWPQCDIWIDRVNPGPLYLMAGSVLKVSHDLGVTWTDVGTASLDSDYVILTGSEAGAPAFYAALRNGAQWELWRSGNGGVSWAYRYAIHDFWETLCASIVDPNIVLFAGVECWRSHTGGAAFYKVNNWWDYYGDPENKLHADFPGMECIWIEGQEVFFMDSDGGTYKSYDGVATVQNISLYGLGISQYYGILTSQTDPYLIAAGSQDQGYQQSLPDRGRAPYLYFDQLISGDYGHLTSTVRDHNMLYSVYPGFTLLQINEEAPQDLRQLDFPPGASYPWMPFILADPADPDVFYFCADHLWRHERTGTGYSYTGTELPYDFAAGGNQYLTALAISPADANRWFAVAKTGTFWYSTNAGQSWTQSPSDGPTSHYFYGTALVASPTDPLVAYAGGSGYSGPAVYRTLDGGMTWEPMGDGLPSTLVFGLAFDNDADQTLFAAAEAGSYRYVPEHDLWVYIGGTEAPLTTYWCLEGVPEIGVVRFGTYGRGIWDYTVGPVTIGVEEPVAGVTPRKPELRAFPNPARERATFAFDLGVPARVTLEVFDVNGRRLAVPADGMRPAGHHEIAFDLTADNGWPLESGVYLARLQTPDGVSVGKLRVVR